MYNSKDALEKLEYKKILQFISKYCLTEKGKEQVLESIPFDKLEKIITEGAFAEEAKNLLIRQSIPPIEPVTNLTEEIRKTRIENSVLDRKKILEILRLSVMSRNLSNYLKNNSESETSGLYNTFQDKLYSDKVLEHHIRSVLNDNAEIKDTASRKLSEIRKEINSLKDDLLKAVKRIETKLKDKGFVQEDYLTLRDGRIVIPIKAEHKRHIKGFIHSESATGQTVYIEPEETLELNNEIVSLYFSEKREEERILRELTKKIGQSADDLSASFEAVTKLDTIFAKGQFAIETLGRFPSINDEKPFYLIDARHPLLLKKLGREKSVPLNIEIVDKKVILITGPNAGGKTVLLKTLGLLTLMVNSGICIPADPDSNFHYFSKLFLDVGDNQSLEEDISTFSSHLSNINQIIKESDEHSLVLIDEIGTGTDPIEGAAIANAVLIKLKENNSTTLATTHFGTLKLSIEGKEGFQNAAMEFDTKDLKPTYKFRQGIPGSSYAFDIARRIGFDEKVLDSAKDFLDTDKHKVEEFLIDIEGKSQKLEEKLRKMEIENSRLEGLSRLYNQNVEKLEKEKKQILKNAKIQAEDYINEVNKKIERLIKEIKESNADKNVIKKSRNILNEIKEENKVYTQNEEPQSFEILVGNNVKIKNTTTVGKVSEIDEDKATVTSGNIRMKVNINDLIPVETAAERENQNNISGENIGYKFPEPKYQLNIRGERVSEAENKIIKFLDDSYTNSLDKVEILHGKGNGILKNLVNEILKKHDAVKNFYFAPVEFGGEGITIVELK
jgi:DNA mismatch repair protein MutS2